MAIDEWTELEYNLALTLTEMAPVTNGWHARAAATRSRLAVEERRYGPHPRERFDLLRPASPRAALIFIHGGFWRARDKQEFTFIAERLVEDGCTVALLNYPLCPDVTLDAIVDSIRRAFLTLWQDVWTDDERAMLVACGHSAGGYLSADLLTQDWAAHGLPESPLKAAVPVSGIFELEPLTRTTFNDALRLDPATARALSLPDKKVASPAALSLVVGGDETAEFQRQTRELHARWSQLSPELVIEPNRHHFDVLDGFDDRASGLYRTLSRHLGL
ncbi:hypothetical protein ASG43_14870 [Aureimonas sp. Leaf454]|uniref:alpha/beta hydrolase n=1 Tax=Aureimonas sp. Leaf454 TaxID=1736381 RepID=UPI0006FCAAA7|nr:alpha/beta hydrolase [Aureimonas sp. Leaf454]KQT44597.1 hypothetical protein ASG43_14870 [Aureimonas sp. Leaf454]